MGGRDADEHAGEQVTSGDDDELDGELRERRLEVLDEIVRDARSVGVDLVAYTFVGSGVGTLEEILPSGELAYLGAVPLDDPVGEE
jgi:hypothetical protein